MLSLAELLRREDFSPLLEELAVCWLDSRPDSMLGMDELGLLGLEAPGMPWLGELGELLEGILAVCGWLERDELLDELDWDCDWDCDELDDDCEGCAGCCDCVCWLLHPAMTTLSTTTEASVCQPTPCRAFLSTAFPVVIVSLLRRVDGAFRLRAM